MASVLTWARSLYLQYWSQPEQERCLYRHIRRQPPRSIVELGVGKGERAIRLIEQTRRTAPEVELRYCGIDWFEARENPSEGLSLKAAHQRLKGRGAQIRLLPGDAYSVLSRHANSLPRVDLLIIGGEQCADSVARAWFFLPRMLHEDSTVFMVVPSGSQGDDSELRRLSREEIWHRAGPNAGHIRRAA